MLEINLNYRYINLYRNYLNYEVYQYSVYELGVFYLHLHRHLFVCAGATLHAISILHYLYVPALLARHDVNLQALVDASRIVIGPSLSSSSPELVQALTSVPLLDRTIFELYSQLSRTVCTLVRGYLPLCVSVDTL